MIVNLDMDGVLADFTGKLIEQYNHLTNEKIKMSDIRTDNIGKYVGDPFLIRKLKEAPGFIRSLEPLDGAIDAVHQLVKDGHDVRFISNATNCVSSGHEKREWLKYHFSKLWDKAPLALMWDKSWVRGDVLLDDTPRNLANLEPDIKGLLFHQHYNASVTGYDRIYDWSQFIDWVNRNG